jgi:hypothetical protein
MGNGSVNRTWIEEIIPLPRPEYPKQPESLLTDLIWRSMGSSLYESPTGRSYLDELSQLKRAKKLPPMERLIPRRTHGSKPNMIETFPIAEGADVGSFILSAPEDPNFIRIVLDSTLAARARGNRSVTCVPMHPEMVVFQTLNGLVNKQSPPNLAKAVEIVGRLGGSDGEGLVAALFLRTFCSPAAPREGLTGLVEMLFPVLAKHVWQKLPQESADPSESLPEWTGVIPRTVGEASPAVLSTHKATPFCWFWNKWTTLCNPANGWRDALPARRFVDWALCLLRTGLAFAYLWEAEFLGQLHNCIAERAISPSSTGALNSLRVMVREGATLATFESPMVPATQKHVAGALGNLLARGYEARRRFIDSLKEDPFDAPPDQGVDLIAETWVASLETTKLAELGKPIQFGPRTAKNQKEFVRYLLQPRSSDDDSADQADFYYLARTNSRSFWFEPGPEWLVVITSLLGAKPGEYCTLGMLLEDLRKLGIKVERWILVGMLEEAGLSMDSPDADNALVIRSGF